MAKIYLKKVKNDTGTCHDRKGKGCYFLRNDSADGIICLERDCRGIIFLEAPAPPKGRILREGQNPSPPANIAGVRGKIAKDSTSVIFDEAGKENEFNEIGKMFFKVPPPKKKKTTRNIVMDANAYMLYMAKFLKEDPKPTVSRHLYFQMIGRLLRPIDEDVRLALKLSKYVHDNCKNVPHDIGMRLVEIISKKYTIMPKKP